MGIRIVVMACTLLLVSSVAVAENNATFLTQKSIDEKGLCEAIKASTPVKQYFEVKKCEYKGTGHLGRGNFTCHPKGLLEKFRRRCSSPLQCKLVPKALTGKLEAEYATMFAGVLRVHDKQLVEKYIHLPKYNQYYAGSCLSQDYYLFREALLGLGIAGRADQVGSLNGLVDQEWKLKEISSGRAVRNDLAWAYWWLGAKDGAEQLVKMVTIEHMQRYPEESFARWLSLHSRRGNPRLL